MDSNLASSGSSWERSNSIEIKTNERKIKNKIGWWKSNMQFQGKNLDSFWFLYE